MRESLVRKLVTAVAVVLLGFGSAVSASAVQMSPDEVVAATWKYAGPYPEPVICNIAGALSGRDWYCSWQVFWWDLYLWED